MPEKFTLDTGGTQRVRVTITNDGSATIGEWSFGSYTLTSGSYSVYSPIAVNASLLDAPLEISGEGTDGSASFDVSFGYTGDYTAAAHGLEEAAITSDTVVQDPDQLFDPDDGFSNAHEFDLTGAAVFRLALPPDSTEADADLDVYVYDPNGDLAATSTAGGTDEEVTIYDPIPGVWTVYVQGWQTIGPDSDYDMSTWTISATPGGTCRSTAHPPRRCWARSVPSRPAGPGRRRVESRCGLALRRQRRAWATPWSRSTTAEHSGRPGHMRRGARWAPLLLPGADLQLPRFGSQNPVASLARVPLRAVGARPGRAGAWRRSSASIS